MAAKAGATSLGSLLMGVCMPSLRENASKIKVKYLLYNDYLNAYFKEHQIFWAYDPDKICKSGDYVLIEELPEKISINICHKVLKVVYPFGDITCPLTDKKVCGKFYREDIDYMNSLYGNLDSRFDYESAPERGWQEGKKDFSHRETFKKYHEFNEENKSKPYEVD